MVRGKRVEIVKLTVDGVEITKKACTKCGEVKALDEFGIDTRVYSGKKSACRSCAAAESRDWRKGNPEKHAELQRKHYARNPDYQKEYNREYRRKYPAKKREQDSTRRAMKYQLPSTKSYIPITECALTFDTGLNTVDHWIPLTIGHGGSYYGNVYSLSGRRNYSKREANPFEWFEANRQRFDLDQSRFDALVWRLAAQNGLTPEEFRKFTYWCFENPRTVEQIAEDNARYGYKKSSLEIWREETGIPFPIAVDFGNTALNNDITRKEDAAL